MGRVLRQRLGRVLHGRLLGRLQIPPLALNDYLACVVLDARQRNELDGQAKYDVKNEHGNLFVCKPIDRSIGGACVVDHLRCRYFLRWDVHGKRTIFNGTGGRHPMHHNRVSVHLLV